MCRQTLGGGTLSSYTHVDLATQAFRAPTLMKTAPSGATEGVTTQLRAVAYDHLGRMAFIDKAVMGDPTLEATKALLEQLRGM